MCDSDGDDILIELSNDEIEAYRLFYKNLATIEYVYVHLYLKNQLRWNILMMRYTEREKSEISDRCKMRFYRHRNGNSEWKTIIGLTGDREYTMFVMTMEESLNELRECLEQSKLIKWHQLPLCVAVHERFHELMFAAIARNNLRVRFNNRCSTFWMDKEIALTVDYTVPSGVELKELNVTNYAKMNESWPYKYPGSEIFIRSIVALNGGLGVYTGGELIAWMMHIECFGIGLLQTVEQHQGKGYARLLTRALTQLISKKYEEDVILFASHGKPLTVELYRRYGFQHVSFTHWFYLEHIRNVTTSIFEWKCDMTESAGRKAAMLPCVHVCHNCSVSLKNLLRAFKSYLWIPTKCALQSKRKAGILNLKPERSQVSFTRFVRKDYSTNYSTVH